MVCWCFFSCLHVDLVTRFTPNFFSEPGAAPCQPTNHYFLSPMTVHRPTYLYFGLFVIFLSVAAFLKVDEMTWDTTSRAKAAAVSIRPAPESRHIGRPLRRDAAGYARERRPSGQDPCRVGRVTPTCPELEAAQSAITPSKAHFSTQGVPPGNGVHAVPLCCLHSGLRCLTAPCGQVSRPSPGLWPLTCHGLLSGNWGKAATGLPTSVVRGLLTTTPPKTPQQRAMSLWPLYPLETVRFTRARSDIITALPWTPLQCDASLKPRRRSGPPFIQGLTAK